MDPKYKIDHAYAVVSVEKECKFCGWKTAEKAKPYFLSKEGGEIIAFCPACRFELTISEQKNYEDTLDK